MTLSAQNKTLAAIYVRVSTEEQAREGFSLAAQEDALKNYCNALGYKIYEIYKDEGKSAKDIKNRPAMCKMLQDAENKCFSAIFIYKLDRFSRSLKDLILTIEKLKEWEVDFVSLQDKMETASASGKLMFHIISAFAEFERNIIGERTSFGMERKNKEGGAVNRPPFGYLMINKKLIPDPEKKGLIKQIFNTYLYNEISLNKLAKMHNLTVNGLKKILTNRTYLGKVKFAGILNKGIHEPLIEEDLFNAVQEKIEKN
ncbi:MAG: recombinase family protein [Nanoarchaeota archaeon]|nr:recombinase family protein [Nanoarchaeota archaeon]MBU1643818.1 recombinase family protein [Nanoarchaeota archaeon]MBU1976670.1 recombinase family protein [Nanoarchaeota archaeon]